MLSTMFILDNTSRAVIQSKFQINDDNSQLVSKAKWNKMEKVENLFNFKHTHICVYMQRKLYKKLTREKFRQNASELG